MQISIDTKSVHELVKVLRAALAEMGKPTGYARARRIIVRAFGYRDYDELVNVNKYIREPKSDSVIRRVELKERIKIYVAGLGGSGFTKREAKELLSKVSTQSWWGIKKGKLRSRSMPMAASPQMPTPEMVPDESEPALERFIADITPSRIRIQLDNIGIAKKMARDLNAFAKANDLEVIGRNDLMAKLFGHASFADLESSMGTGSPSIQDWYVPIEHLGERIGEYFRILMAAGFSADQTKEVLRVVGVEGWWSFAELRRKLGEEQQVA